MNTRDVVTFVEALQEYERATSHVYRASVAERLIDAYELVESSADYDAPAMRALHAVDMLIEHINSAFDVGGDPTDHPGYFRARDARDLLRVIVADSIVAAGRADESAPMPAAFCADGLVAALTADDTGAHAAHAAE